MRAVILLAIALAVIPAAGASLVENGLQAACNGKVGLACVYQHDGGANGDASDLCTEPFPAIPARGTVNGMVVPADDARDNYALGLVAGQQVDITLRAQSGLIVQLPTGAVALNVDLRVYGPGCGVPLAESAHRGGGSESVSFTAPQTATYTVQVQLGSFYGLPLAAAPPDGPTTDACDPVCQGLLNSMAGYQMALR